MKKSISIALVAGILAVGASAYEAGEKYKCTVYKEYYFESSINYEYTEKEMKDSVYSFEFKDSRTVVSSGDTYKYLATNKNGWDIFKQVDGEIIFSISDGKDERTGMVTTGVLSSKDSDNIKYGVCKKIK